MTPPSWNHPINSHLKPRVKSQSVNTLTVQPSILETVHCSYLHSTVKQIHAFLQNFCQKLLSPWVMDAHCHSNRTNTDTPIFPLPFPLSCDWPEQCCVARPKPLALFHHLRRQGCIWTLDFFLFFSPHTQNGQLADREKTLGEFDKMCNGSESMTAFFIHKQTHSINI